MGAVSCIFCMAHRRYFGIIEVVISYVPEIQRVFVQRYLEYPSTNNNNC